MTCQHCTSEAVEDLVAAGFPYPTAVLLAEAGYGISLVRADFMLTGPARRRGDAA